MQILRTPDAHFEGLADYPFTPHYADVAEMRLHYLDEGAGQPVVLLHGEPSWSYLYRHMITPLADAGYRVLAPDLIGFGRSDKPANQADYTYQSHVDWMLGWFDQLDLDHVVLFGQDWGGLIGLRMVVERPERFDAVVVGNTGLPTGDHDPGEAFAAWREFSRTVTTFDIGRVIDNGTARTLDAAEIAAYNAPFPDEDFKAGARIFPSLVPVEPDDPAAQPNRDAWAFYVGWEKPFVTAFSDSDPITAGAERPFQKLIPGAQGQSHVTIENAGHFLQEDQPAALVQVIADTAAATS